MESQIPRPQPQSRDDEEQLPSVGLPSVIEGQDEPHHDKKSVLKKAKEKAKKIKDTIKKHGHGDEHDHDQNGDEDEDEEMEQDPEVHGAPMYESTTDQHDGIRQQAGVNLENPTTMAEDQYNSKITDQHMVAGNKVGESAENFEPGRKEENMGRTSRLKLGTPTTMEEDPHAPKDRPNVSNYQCKVNDPTGQGGEEAGMAPILHAFDKMTVSDESDPKPPQPEVASNLYTGSHDQFFPEPLPSSHAYTNPADPGSVLKSLDSNKPERVKPDQSGDAGKISSAIADKAIAAKNVVASKLGYGGTEGTGSSEGGESKGWDKCAAVKEYLAEKLRPSEEDKALSEAISDALRKRKDEPGKQAVGKVTESEEVARRLGTGDDGGEDSKGMEGADSRIAASVNDTGTAVVDKLKGAVGSWLSFGVRDQPQNSQASAGTTYGFSSSPSGGVGRGRDGGREQRLQESGN